MTTRFPTDLSGKTTPVDADQLLLSDSEDSNNAKNLTIANLKAQLPGIGDVVGAVSSTDNALVRFNGTNGKTIQDGTITQDDSGNLASVGTVNGNTIFTGPDTFVGKATTDTLTNKTIDTASNTITNIGLTNLDNTLDHTAYYGWIGFSHTNISAVVTSDGATVTLTFQKSGGGDVEIIFSTGQTTVDCTPALTLALTAGTDTTPTLNYVYITLAAPTVLTKSTTGFPTGEEFMAIGTYLVQSAATVQTYGLYKAHQWTDHIWTDTTENGHLTHLNSWIRKQPATWGSGTLLTPTLTPGAPDTLTFAVGSGEVLQLHDHTVPAFDSSGVGTTNLDTFFVVNDFSAAYTAGKDLYNFKEDSLGNAAVNNNRISWVVWGAVDETDNNYKIFVNLPGGFYGTDAAAIADSSRYSNYNIPADYIGVGFLIAKLTYKYTTAGGGTLDLVENLDLRGQFPSIFAGGSAAATTEFLDTAFRIQDDGDNTKEIAFEASGITTATTRTLTIPDASGTITLNDSTSTLTNKTFDANGTGNSISNIDVADLSNGTDGELITWDAAGAPATVTVGTSGQVLTSNGAGAAPTFQDSAGGGSTTTSVTGMDFESSNANATRGVSETIPHIGLADGVIGTTSFGVTVPDGKTGISSVVITYYNQQTSKNVNLKYWATRFRDDTANNQDTTDTYTTNTSSANVSRRQEFTVPAGAYDALTIQAGDLIGFTVLRDANDAADTYATSFDIIGATITWS